MMEQSPEEIVIFGIQPEKIEMQMGLTGTLQRRVPDYLAEITAEVGRSS